MRWREKDAPSAAVALIGAQDELSSIFPAWRQSGDSLHSCCFLVGIRLARTPAADWLERHLDS